MRAPIQAGAGLFLSSCVYFLVRCYLKLDLSLCRFEAAAGDVNDPCSGCAHRRGLAAGACDHGTSRRRAMLYWPFVIFSGYLERCCRQVLRQEPMRAAVAGAPLRNANYSRLRFPKSATCDRLLNLANQGARSRAGSSRRGRRCIRVTPVTPRCSRQTGKLRSCHGHTDPQELCA